MTAMSEDHGYELGKQAVQGAIDSCVQSIELVSALSKNEYTKTEAGTSSIGAHMRHCLEHYLEFMQGFPNGRIKYDERKRDVSIELSPDVYISKMNEIIDFLSRMTENCLHKEFIVYLTPCKGAKPQPMMSNAVRELAFLSSHTIHHIALVKFLAESLGIELSEEIGLAYATKNHRDKTSA